MTTRGRIARGEHQQEFEGHVQRWLKQWEQVGGTSKMKVLKWVPTGDRSESKAGPRFPHLRPVRDSSLKVVFRPKQQPPPEMHQPLRTTEENPESGKGAAAAMQLDEKAPAPLMQADVPMSEGPAAAEEAQQGIGPEQQNSRAGSGEANSGAVERQQQDDSAGVRKHEGQASDASACAQTADRAVAEEAAQETIAALKWDSAAEQAVLSAPAAAPTPGSPAVPRDVMVDAAASSAIADRTVVQQEHANASAPAGPAPGSARPSGLADAVKAEMRPAKESGGPIDSTSDEPMPDAQAQP